MHLKGVISLNDFIMNSPNYRELNVEVRQHGTGTYRVLKCHNPSRDGNRLMLTEINDHVMLERRVNLKDLVSVNIDGHKYMWDPGNFKLIES